MLNSDNLENKAKKGTSKKRTSKKGTSKKGTSKKEPSEKENRFSKYRIGLQEKIDIVKIKHSKRKAKKSLVKTSITIKTEYLKEKLKAYSAINFAAIMVSFLGSLLTVITTVHQNFEKLKTAFSEMDISNGFTAFLISFFREIPVGEVTVIMLAFCLLIATSVSLVYSVKYKNRNKFINRIVEDQYETEEHTAIFIIKMVFSNIPKILVFRQKSWKSFFLPYCYYDENDNSLTDLYKRLAEILEVASTDIEIKEFENSERVVIKKNKSHDEMSKINYKFFYVRFTNPTVGRKYQKNENKHFSWKSKYELEEDNETMLNNGDVIDIIDELALINRSSVAFREPTLSSFDIPNEYSIIWNITNVCEYDCPICATNSGKNCKCQTTSKEKMTILQNLSTISGHIDRLDFSGGDPLLKKADREIIKLANKILPYSERTVTTTGLALSKLSLQELSETVEAVDVTYDIPYEVCEDDFKEYREYEYNVLNFREIERISNSGLNIKINVHVPILPPMVTNEKLVGLILKDIHKINPTEVKFIRLMPVGRMAPDKIKSDYSPQKFLEAVNNEIENSLYRFKISYNCSLGVQINKRLDPKRDKIDIQAQKITCRTCGMLTKKLGIDCDGHVYACIWAAYVDGYSGSSFAKNPFYLGDLKKNTMYEILTSPKIIKFRQTLEYKRRIDGCPVCSWVSAMQGKNYDTSTIWSIDKILNLKSSDTKEFIDPISHKTK